MEVTPQRKEARIVEEYELTPGAGEVAQTGSGGDAQQDVQMDRPQP